MIMSDKRVRVHRLAFVNAATQLVIMASICIPEIDKMVSALAQMIDTQYTLYHQEL